MNVDEFIARIMGLCLTHGFDADVAGVVADVKHKKTSFFCNIVNVYADPVVDEIVIEVE